MAPPPPPQPPHPNRGRGAVTSRDASSRQSPAPYESLGSGGRGPGRRRSSSNEPLSRPTNKKTTKPKKKKKKKKRKITHRAYGLPNANQIFLTMVVVGMLFVQLLRPNWLIFEQSDATAGLSGLRVAAANDTTTRIAWDEFCDPQQRDYTLPIDETQLQPQQQPFASREIAIRACNSNTPEIVRVLTATSIAFSMLSVTIALYFHLGSPSQQQVVLMGVIPGCSLLATALLGTAALAVWQEHFGEFDNGDCFSVCVASTVIAYVVSVSMAIRWRWPGIFAVDNEQQAFETRRNWRRHPPAHATAQDSDVDADIPQHQQHHTSHSPRAVHTFHTLV